MPDFVLHPQLAADSVAVAPVARSLGPPADERRAFPWLMLIPRRAGVAEIIDLAKPDRAALFEEIVTRSRRRSRRRPAATS